MIFGGLTKTTLLDFPGHVAASVFTRGCNFRCPYCHNSELLDFSSDEDTLSEEEVLSFLKKRAAVLEGLCITGGEPTLQKDLPDFIRKVRALGLKIKLDTNGTNPALLKELLDEGLLDYVAMDIKNAPEKYAATVGSPEGAHSDPHFTDIQGSPDSGPFSSEKLMDNIRTSVSLLLNAGIPYEFRTTVVKGFHEKADFAAIDELIAGAKQYFIQSYLESEQVLSKAQCGSFTKEELIELISDMTHVSPSLRGIE